MTYLLDANTLIAMGDSNHVHHRRVQDWFHRERGRAWATCPLTENAFLRIVGATSYPGTIGEPQILRTLLERMCAFPGHQFWEDSVSLRDATVFPELPGSKHLTDIYLLALAVAKGGKLATLDRRIDPATVPGGGQAYFLIP
jgi:toxin-antitoxin system PIN domain toxin